MTAQSTVERFFAAANAHDVEATLSCLASDFECRGPGGFALDRDQFRVWLGWEAVMGHQYQMTEVRSDGDSVTCLMRESSELYRLLGMQVQRIRLRFDVVGEAIRVQEFEPLPSGPTFQEAIEPVVHWARSERPGSLDGIYVDGSPVFTRESAERWLLLIRGWHRRH